jgi:hypothetical protein
VVAQPSGTCWGQADEACGQAGIAHRPGLPSIGDFGCGEHRPIYTLRLLRVHTKGEGERLRKHRQSRLQEGGLLCARLVASRPIAAGGSDETDAADAIFGPRAHPNHPASGATLTRERDFDPESAEKRLRPS